MYASESEPKPRSRESAELKQDAREAPARVRYDKKIAVASAAAVLDASLDEEVESVKENTCRPCRQGPPAKKAGVPEKVEPSEKVEVYPELKLSSFGSKLEITGSLSLKTPTNDGSRHKNLRQYHVFLELDPNVFYAKELNFSDENIAAAVVRMTYVTFINVYRGNTEFNFSSRVEVFTHLAEMNDRLVQLGEKPLDYNTNLDVSYEVNTSNTRPRHAKLNQEQRSMIVAIWKKHALAPFHTPVRI